ncbi:Beta-1,4-galactosyltransferase 4 [Hypsibius exemplaris]|uniref:Beta-1,4-N-acetylgalactosaminyltransferase n=1 Tax=Hypsibius exemplaris TaxID=2072580 RepID=A0A1W0X5C0_HYPEX|nr:Beta-1,4-galactosyltransferase 4 [Hypsibius exemplaris]
MDEEALDFRSGAAFREFQPKARKSSDAPLYMLMLFILVLVVLTLSEIAMVKHSGGVVVGRGGFHMTKKAVHHDHHNSEHLKVESLLPGNVPSMELSKRLWYQQFHEIRIQQILNQVIQGVGDPFIDAELLDGNGMRPELMWSADNNSYALMEGNATMPVLSLCPEVPPDLQGQMSLELERIPTFEHLIEENPNITPGGTFKPAGCIARYRIAIIIPYRDREAHLKSLLHYLHPVLQRQQLEYRVIVVEQLGEKTFNKARIMNSAFKEALKHSHYDCFIFHDVDLIPENDRNFYGCPEQPRHMSVAVNELGYRLTYADLVGGVLAFRTEHFFKVNGYSNLYWGWGAEDDDMAYRIRHVGLKVIRPPPEIARYSMIKHVKRTPVEKRQKLLYTALRRYKVDGLNSLEYKLSSFTEKPMYTHVIVDIGDPPPGF